MKNLRWGYSLLLVAGILSTGCMRAGVDGSVPWWKGMPASVIAPSSLEAHAWRNRHHVEPTFVPHPEGLPTQVIDEVPPPVLIE